MQITARSACQTKINDMASTTKSTEQNITKLRVYLSNETKTGRNTK